MSEWDLSDKDIIAPEAGRIWWAGVTGLSSDMVGGGTADATLMSDIVPGQRAVGTT